jgi:RnfABCDGE-type electron transport complex G subunit
MKTWDNFIKPIVVLGAICLISSVLLAFTNSATAPVIEANDARIANENRAALLPTADSFTQVKTDVEGVTEMYKADNDTGYVITASSKGYGGAVPVMVAFNMDGQIVAVKFLDNSETPGLGQKVKTAAFQDQFAGMTAEEFSLSDIDAITGATISSGAAVNAINDAVKAYQEATGTAEEELTPEQILASLLPDGGTLTEVSVDIPNIVKAYKGENGGVVIYAEGPGFYKKMITVGVGIDADGVITGIWIDGSNETDGVGTQIGKSKFTEQFIGMTAATVGDADAVAGATVSSDAAIAVIETAMAAFDTVKEA